MGRRAKSKAKSEYSEDEEKPINNSSFVFCESDDDEANEDLSLKIIKKAMSRASQVDDSEVTGAEDIITTELVASEVASKVIKKVKKVKKEKKEKKKKAKKVEDEIKSTLMDEENKADTTKGAEVVDLAVSSAADNSNSDNAVLRRLLRGPRYFDPPDKSWGACFNCGEDGHTTVNCTSARRKKPCFICGSLEHEVKQCQKGKDCYICKEGGHRAKDCPKKFKRCAQASELCLKCGASAHNMPSCNNDYYDDDLKEIQCYVCKRFGHLCCVNYFDGLLSEASCYKCGQSGHNGQACRGSKGERETSSTGTPSSCFKCGEEGHFARECINSSTARKGSRGETSATGTPTSCFKCGEEGHFARECINSSMANNRTRDFSTPTRKHSRDNKASKGFKSAPQEFGNTNKKRLHYENGSPNWSSKSKWRGGWIADDPSDFTPTNGWRSPATPNKRHKIYSGGQGSSSHSSNRWGKFSSGGTSSQGYASGYHQRFSASRFGNSSSNGVRRNYDRW